MKTVLGIDLGTQSLKAVVYDYAAGSIVASSSAALDVDRDAHGKAEQSAADWLQALRAALAAIDVEVRDSIRAIGVSGQQHGFVAVDASGRVVAPVKLWCDTSTQAEADEITAACGGRAASIALTGNPVLTGYTAPKIRRLRHADPDAYRVMTTIMLPHDYLNFALTGVAAMEHGDASGTGLLDVRARRWSAAMLAAVDPDRDLAPCLPPLRDAGAVLGTTTSACAATYGLPPGIPVATGGGDNMMAAIGTGNVAPGRLTMSLGTSGTLFACSDVPIVDERGNIAAFCNSTGGWLPLLCTLNCTSATELMRAPLGISIDEFDAVIDGVAAGSDGLIVLPYFSGERTPDLPHARAEMLGLDTTNCTKGHLLRATVEGVTFGLRFGLDELRRLGVAADNIVLTGGGARSPAWRRIVADVCDLPVTTLVNDEGACFGAALQALWMLGRRDDSQRSIADIAARHVEYGGRIAPDRERAAVYAHRYALYREAVRRVGESSAL